MSGSGGHMTGKRHAARWERYADVSIATRNTCLSVKFQHLIEQRYWDLKYNIITKFSFTSACLSNTKEMFFFPSLSLSLHSSSLYISFHHCLHFVNIRLPHFTHKTCLLIRASWHRRSAAYQKGELWEMSSPTQHGGRREWFSLCLTRRRFNFNDSVNNRRGLSPPFLLSNSSYSADTSVPEHWCWFFEIQQDSGVHQDNHPCSFH